MKNFFDFLHERVMLRARKDMPQIDDMDKFVKDIKDNGFKITSKKVDPKTLKPTQNEFNDEKVKGMIATGKYKNKTIVVTKDNYILDGHHRWKAHLEVGEQQPIIQINMSFEDLFDFVEGKPYIKYKKIHETVSVSNYMTDEEREQKSQETYNNFFTVEMFDKIFNDVKNKKKLQEDGEGGSAPAGGEGGESSSSGDDKVNSVTGVSMPATVKNNMHRRKDLEDK